MAQYTHGHHESVLRSHTWRTAANSAAYLLPHLKPHFSVLDVGCGPGTITADLALIVKDGKVVALDEAEGILAQAAKACDAAGAKNVEFKAGDVHALPFEDGTFDVVHAHQVLQHVRDPVSALKEMKRVTKKGGIVAVRDADYASFSWYPPNKTLDAWGDLYQRVARSNGGEPDAGRMLHAWARQAGFERSQVAVTASCWIYATKEEVEWWSGLWADRITTSKFAETAMERGFATREQLEEMKKAWHEWGKEEDAWFSVPSGEIICRVA
ncbi:putative methyltransferase [Hyaloraphidium curvatum]|nr:putative methyltransferase [Hyaloraphidium curvatum]